MLILIHGDHQVKARQELQNQIAKAKQAGITDMVTLDGRICSLSEIIQSTESQSLFGTSTRLTIIENLFRRRSKTELTEIIDYLSTCPPDQTLLLWDDKTLTATQLKPLTNFKKIVFPLPKIIFKLTDAFTPNANLSGLLTLLESACAADSAELVLIMLARQLRLMLQKKSRGPGFPESQAIKLHHQLAEIDYQNKSGRLALDLQSELSNWLIKVYQQ